MPGLREVLVTLGLEVDKGSEQKVQGALSRVTDLAKGAVAAFAAFKVGQFASRFVDEMRGMGDELDKTSIQLGLTTDALQEMRHAAGLAGVDAPSLSIALATLGKNAYEASIGNLKLQQQFKALGVSVKDSQGNLKSTDVLLSEMADGFQALENDTEKTTYAMTIMGESGRKLLPMFGAGAKGIREARDETKKLGVGMTQDVIAASVKLTDTQARLDLAMLSIKNTIARVLIPVFERWTASAIEIAVAVRGPLKGALQTLESVVRGLRMGFKFIDEQFGKTTKTILGVAVAVAALGAAFAFTGKVGFLAGLKAAAGWILATAPALLMVALLGIIIATIALVIEDLMAMGDGAESVSGTLIQGFNDLVDELGSIPAAIDEMLKTAVSFWLNFFKDTLGLTDEFIANVEETFSGLIQTTVEFWSSVADSIKAGWTAVTDWIASVWQATVDGLDFAIGGAIRAIIASFQALFAFIMGDFEAAAQYAVVALENAWQQIKNGFTMLVSYLSFMWEFWTGTIPALISDVMAWTWDIISSTFSSVLSFLLSLWKAQWDLLVQIVQFVMGGLASWFSSYFEFLGTLWGTAVAFWKEVIGGWIDGVVETIGGAFDSVVEGVRGIWDPIIAFWRGLFEGFIGGITEKFGAVAGFFGRLFGGEEAQEERQAAATSPRPAGRARREAGRTLPPGEGAAPGVQRPLGAPGGTGTPGAPTPIIVEQQAAQAPPVSIEQPAAQAPFISVAPTELPAFMLPEAQAAAPPAPKALRERVVGSITGAMGAQTTREAGQTMATGAASLAAVASPTAAGASMAPPVVMPPSPAQGPVVNSSPSTSIEVNVDAAGKGDAPAIAEQVARQVDAALERRDRQTIRAFTTAVAAGGA